MTITATILQDTTQAGGAKRNSLIEYDDDIDSSSITELKPVSTAVDLQAWADDRALSLEEQRRQLELASNFEIIRNGGNSETDVTLLRNTTEQWEEYLFKGMSNLKWGDAVADFAHVFRESQANQRARDATGLTNAQVVAWSGDVQPVEIGRINYETGHPNEPGELYFFDGFPTE